MAVIVIIIIIMRPIRQYQILQETLSKGALEV